MNQAVIQPQRRQEGHDLRAAATLPRIALMVESADIGRLVLRLTLGLLLLLHGVAKAEGGLVKVMESLAQAGLPDWLAYGAYVGEIVAPLLLIAGFWTRWAALVVVINMVVAVALVHLGDLTRLAPTGGWALELQAFYLLSAVAVALLGAGRFSVDASARAA